MDTVGIRELKAHLSRHLKRVRSGARLIVTERGRSIATISPVDTPADVAGRIGSLLTAGRTGAAASLSAALDRTRHTGANGFRRGPRGSRVTLYLDTSSLVKLYVAEAGSDAVRGSSMPRRLSPRRLLRTPRPGRRWRGVVGNAASAGRFRVSKEGVRSRVAQVLRR